jgi:gas vesicle structural protein
MTMPVQRNRYMQSPSSSGLYEILDLILEKGLVIEAFVRISVIGIEILTIEARIVIASVDTYLRYAEAVTRLGLTPAAVHGRTTVLREVADTVVRDDLRGAVATVGGTVERAFEYVDDSLLHRRPATRVTTVEPGVTPAYSGVAFTDPSVTSRGPGVTAVPSDTGITETQTEPPANGPDVPPAGRR